ncbi:NeuD/PglB/VioB family sugar acetyltransferase [Marinobacter salinisoli]|uniref:NeuD/PglB/VioB family sugar acetyltransferase n=1 Tax=Marinobacter salinisoli TaxID=2769486 RepID=A0ABX7MSV2_9GAMM|nr:NeuD/PglB/VioB family sugar acetyltransferase [Marinobacter salinisoli]QSP94484.1 NeuD/PglB/VioB family sugar acetyltransferase [Marinobacter salinisoli]
MKKLGVFGTSGFAREIADIADELGYEPFLIAKDETEAAIGSSMWPIVLESDLEQAEGTVYALGIGENNIRAKVVNRYSGKLSFVNLIHPSASFGKHQLEQIQAQEGVIICAGVRFTNNIDVGSYSIFNLNATIGHDVIIEDFVNIAPGAHISGNVLIERECWVGTGAVINQGSNEKKLMIGAGTTIGSGAVVIKDCEEQAVYVGAPARRIK